MITEITKYGKDYETPQGLEEKRYYELMYEFVDLAFLCSRTTQLFSSVQNKCISLHNLLLSS